MNNLTTKKALWVKLLQYHLVTTDLKVTQRQKEEFHVALILAGLNPDFEPYKTQILAIEELPTVNNMFRHLNHSFLEQSFVVPSNDSSALVTSAGGRGSDCGSGRSGGGRDGRDGSRGNGGRCSKDGGRGGG